jgi:hypothetical protein
VHLQAHKYDHNALQRRLADSHETSRLLRARMEELLGFLEEMLVVTPPQKHAAERRAHVSACLNETRSLLADLSVNIGDQCKFAMSRGVHDSASSFFLA